RMQRINLRVARQLIRSYESLCYECLQGGAAFMNVIVTVVGKQVIICYYRDIVKCANHSFAHPGSSINRVQVKNDAATFGSGVRMYMCRMTAPRRSSIQLYGDDRLVVVTFFECHCPADIRI